MRQEFRKYSLNYLDRQLLSEGSAVVYARHRARACGVLGGLSVARIARHDVERMLAEAMGDGLAPSTIKGLLAFTRAVLRDAGNPAANGMRVKVPDPKVRAMSEAEATAFRAALPANRYGAALLVLLRTGMRESELLNMGPHDWVASSQEAHVMESKSGSHRVVDVPDDTVPVLDNLWNVKLYARQLRKVMAATCTAAGIARFRVHDLRHTRITHQLLAGVPVLYVSAQAGHNSPGYTMSVYGHLVVASQSQRREWSNA